MTLHLGSDHAGFPLKQILRKYLTEQKYLLKDHGTYDAASVDYPDFGHAVAQAVLQDAQSLGIAMCGSGNGISMALNHHRGIRAALAWNTEIAALGRQHNNANVLALPARFISEEEAIQIVEAFLSASFEGGRHQRRVEKIDL